MAMAAARAYAPRMKFTVRAYSAMGVRSLKPTNAATALRSILSLRKEGFEDVRLVQAGEEIDIDRFIIDHEPKR